MNNLIQGLIPNFTPLKGSSDIILADTISVPIFAINRHRINSDGLGVTTLIAFSECPLKCKYCINPECHKSDAKRMTAKELYDIVMIDEIYFRCSNGGITFGGGEPLLYPNFISEFKNICEDKWTINVETSLNVPLENLKTCVKSFNTLFVDLKCITNSKYISYTGKSNRKVLRNLQWLSINGFAESVIVRIPNIPNVTDNSDIDEAMKFCQSYGFNNTDQFDYILPSDLESKKSMRLDRGKSICKVLKQIRHTVANNNGLFITSPECTFDGPCLGTCPICDSELKDITQYIKILEDNNIEICYNV